MPGRARATWPDQRLILKTFLGTALAVLAASVSVAAVSDAPPRLVASHPQAPPAPAALSPQAVVEQSCVGCHNDRAKAGGLSRCFT
jgi:mono/diheme cytochrome c family protein